MKDKYIDECKVIKQDCEYTAETHHLMAVKYRNIALGFQLIPALIATASGAISAFGVDHQWIQVVTVISAAITAVATILNPNKRYEEHLSAAKAFTVLKHDARFLFDAEATTLSDDAFFVRVENLHDQYNALVRAVPPTEGKFFERARKKIQLGRHTPDRDAKGNIV